MCERAGIRDLASARINYYPYQPRISHVSATYLERYRQRGHWPIKGVLVVSYRLNEQPITFTGYEHLLSLPPWGLQSTRYIIYSKNHYSFQLVSRARRFELLNTLRVKKSDRLPLSLKTLQQTLPLLSIPSCSVQCSKRFCYLLSLLSSAFGFVTWPLRGSTIMFRSL